MPLLRIVPLSLLVCSAVLVGFAAGAHSTNVQKGDGFSFNDDADIEGSGAGEVSQDLDEASGSGNGPSDDEDTPVRTFDKGRETIPERPNIDFVPEPEDTSVKETLPSSTDGPTVIMNPKPEDRHASFFAQPGILAAVIGGAVVGLLCAILVVMFIVYRMRKKDEGSYALGEPKQSPTTTSYRGGNNKEFYA